MSTACLIANPAAGRGRGARRLPAVRAALAAFGIDDVRLTRGPGDERVLAEAAATDGISTIVALGGDGTWGNVARGILASGRDPRLVPIAAGTGNDFPHSLGLPARDAVAMARIAAGVGSVRVDMGAMNGVAFLNVTGIGLEARVLQAIGRFHRLRGPLVYMAAAVPLLRSYRALQVAVQYDEEPPGPREPILALVVSNGPRFGGGFRIAPGASVRDGLLDVVTVRDAPVVRRLQLFLRARLGSHLGQPEVSRRAVGRVRVHLDEPPVVDADGELHQPTDTVLDIRVLPGAIRVGTTGQESATSD